MRKFKFRLEQVLNYRVLQETWAKDAFLAAKRARLSAEEKVAKLAKKHSMAQSKTCSKLEDRVALEAYLSRLTEEISAEQAIADILLAEEEKARSEWTTAKQNRQALTKLKTAAEIEWAKEQALQEGKQLDEWSSSRRAA